MPNLSIKNVPAEVVEKLRQRAAANHRSLQGELMALVCRAAESAHGKGEEQPAETPSRSQTGTRSIEDIAAEHRRRQPQPIDQGPQSTAILRADRDAR